MVVICKGIDCKKRSTFNLEGLKPMYCKKCSSSDMVDVASKLCLEKGCNKNPTFNLEGLKRMYCKNHASAEMVNVINKRCLDLGCNKQPTFNLPGLKAEWCKLHSSRDMIDVFSKKCLEPGCNKQANFNLEGLKAEWCKKHASVEMVLIGMKRCKENGCDKIPHYNYKNEKVGLYCCSHKLPLMCDVKNIFCIDCGLTIVKKDKYNEGKCSVCNIGSHQKQREEEVKQLFLKNNLTFIHNKQFPNDCNNRSRPDFLFDCLSFFLIVEVDENAHSSYNKDCDIARSNNILYDLPLPAKFLRFNPDNNKFTTKHKQKVLLKTVNEYLNKTELDNIEPVYLFY